MSWTHLRVSLEVGVAAVAVEQSPNWGRVDASPDRVWREGDCEGLAPWNARASSEGQLSNLHLCILHVHLDRSV